MKTISLLLVLCFCSGQVYADDGVQLQLSAQISSPALKTLTLNSPLLSADESVKPSLVIADSLLSASEKSTLNKMIDYALSLSNTRYKYSGISEVTGFDCSGFVSHVFGETLGIKLPHSAKSIWTEGEKVTVKQLNPGDLVFFNTLRRKLSHIGIYLGNGRFIHAASHGGVRVDSLHTAYWQPRWNGARRIAAFN
ncbi:MAG: C40 family peptidase [Gallionella sp.]